MKKAVVIAIFLAVLAAVVLGITASDLWGYFIELTRIAFAYITNWLLNALEAMRDALWAAVNGESEEEIDAVVRMIGKF